MRKTVAIVGAGPAGLTAAYELLARTDALPIVIEQSDLVGGISRTEKFEGNRIDIGGHRFFSKSDRVMKWWLDRMPMQKTVEKNFAIHYQGGTRSVEAAGDGPDPDQDDRVMLVRSRKSRIYWRRRLFDYPLSLSPDTVRKMGLWRLSKSGLSYARSMAFPIRPETTLEHFIINRFGRELYETFFKAYTEKVWGVPCEAIPADWGAQRIKGLSITKAIHHAMTRMRNATDIAQKNVETSLIERFLYPKYGPGQMWEIVADEIRAKGGQILHGMRVERLAASNGCIQEVCARDVKTGEELRLKPDHVISSMPIRELIAALGDHAPDSCRSIADGLMYRDFFTVGLLARKLKLVDEKTGGPLRDTWIYIQEPDVQIGRLQLFGNWSPYMVADPSKTWLGLEYFCNETDEIWSRSDDELVQLGRCELDTIGIVDAADFLDGCVIRMKKTYPAYFGAYARFGELRSYLDTVANLFCVGRNGQHRYNNQDHSMLTAMLAVDHIAGADVDKTGLWDVNTEQEYHEEKLA